MRMQFICSLVALATLFGTKAEAIDLVWQWSFTANSTLNQGYFVTDGGPFTSSTPVAGNYQINNFVVTQGSLASGAINPFLNYSGGIYNKNNQGVQGFLWNGTAATQFYRDGGAATNGFGMYLNGGGYSDNYVFGISSNNMVGLVKSNMGTLALSAVAVNVPEPSTYALGAIATGFMAAVARRRKARKA